MHRAVLIQEHEIKVMPGYLYQMGVLAAENPELGACYTLPGITPHAKIAAMEHFLLPQRDCAQMVSTASQQGKLIRLMQPFSDVFAVIEGDKEAKINSIQCARSFRLRAWPLALMEKMKGQQEYEGKACCRFSVREEE